jgi:hypothetical protein
MWALFEGSIWLALFVEDGDRRRSITSTPSLRARTR